MKKETGISLSSKFKWICLVLGALLVGCSSPVFTPTVTSSPPTEIPVSPTETLPVLPTETQPVLPTTLPTPMVAPATSIPLISTPGAPLPVSFTSLKMIDDQTGWGISSTGQILMTVGGMNAWQDVTPKELANLPPMQSPLQPIAFFLDASHAWVTYPENNGDLVVQQTTDGGQTWQPPITLPAADLAGELGPISFYFLDPQNGWLWADIHPGMMHVYPILFGTTDGGLSWQTDYSGVPNASSSKTLLTGSFSLSYGSKVFTFLNKNSGLAGTGSLYSSPDGGRTWETIQLKQPAGLPSFTRPYTYVTPPIFGSAMDGAVLVTMYEFDNVYIPPGDLFQGLPKASYLAWTHDGGNTWKPSNAPALEGMLTLLDGQNGWFLGKSDPSPDAPDTLFVTSDGGKSWSPVGTDSTVPLGSQIQFVNANDGFALQPDRGAVAFFGNYDSRLVQGNDYLLQTLDGGKSWTPLQAAMKGS